MSDKNKVGVLAAISYVVSNIVGTGIFISPTGILRESGSVGLALIIWAACGLMSIIGALCFIELGTSIRSSGADFAYQTYVGWNALAFALVLTQNLLQFPSSIAIQLSTIAAYLVQAIEMTFCLSYWNRYFVQTVFGLLVLYLLAFLNFYSIEKYAAKVQIVAFIAKVSSLLCISGVGIYYFISGKATDAFDDAFDGTTLTSGGIIAALYGGFWAYSGWDALNYGLEDVKNPQIALPVAAAGGAGLVTIIYLSTNVAYFAVLGKEGSLASDAVVVTFCDKVFGTVVASVIPAVVGLMAATSLNTGIFSVSRQLFAVSRKGYFPSLLSCLTPETDSPRPAIFVMCFLSTVMMLIGNLEILMGYVNFVGWFSHGISIGVMIWIRIRHIPVDSNAIKLPLVIHIVFFLVCSYLVLVPIYEKPIVGGVGFAVVLAGVLLYFAAVRNTRLPRCFATFDGKVTKLSQIIFDVTSRKQAPVQKQNKSKEKVSGRRAVSPSKTEPQIFVIKF